MDLLLVRHALPLRVEVESGPADPALSEVGRAQADQLARYLTGERVDRLFSSPMTRARQTAEAVAAATGLDIEVRDGLAEFDALSSEYIPIEELKASGDPRWQEMVAGTWTPEGGMTREEFRATVVPTIETIVDECRSQRVVVSCHGGVINAYLTHVLGIADPLVFEPRYTSITRIAASSRGHRTLVSVNEIEHLEDVRHGST